MSVFSTVESGTNWLRSKFAKSISKSIRYDCRFHECIPVLKKFMLPGDVAKIAGDVLVRFQPMLSPTLTPNTFRVRYFFVPLRLIEENTELILTGSKNGKLYEDGDLPTFKNFVGDANKTDYPNAYKVAKWSFWDYMRCQIMDYEAIKTDECLPAQYWYKAYMRIWFDYYRDENYDSVDDFDNFWATEKKKGVDVNPFFSELKKDYFTSSLPWQLKGTSPTINVFGNTGTVTWSPNFSSDHLITGSDSGAGNTNYGMYFVTDNVDAAFGATSSVTGNATNLARAKKHITDYLNQNQSISGTVNSIGFDADDLRTMMAQTRIFERLARAGSRYTEYLRANFGTAPLDETMQRAQYLGGWSIPIVTTEVLQTAEDGSTPVGTMRGHGITRGGNRISTFHCKEFGVLFGIAEIRPDVEYTTGIPRELTYKRRFDFFNPSFQHLSEQEVRNGELFVDNSDGLNDTTLGFQAYANELRTSQNETVGDLRDSLHFWNQALTFASRPNVSGLLHANNHLASFNSPFAVNGTDARPCIVVFQNILEFYRPMVRYATPGLVDHL